MGRIETAFADASLKKPAFIGFSVAGDPDKTPCIRIARALIAGGTDILELGVPFSDPVADGPTIQKADERALAARTTPYTVFEIVREIRKGSDVPIVFLTYYNSVHRRGVGRFYYDARDAGVDGILIADMPVEESGEVCAVAAQYDIDPIFLITQTTSDERIKKIAAKARGYLYLVAVLGVTGVRDQVSEGAIELLHRVRRHTTLPLALGFGISTPAHAHTCARAGADGVIVGSAIVEIVDRQLKNPDMMERELQDYVRGMKQAAPASSGMANPASVNCGKVGGKTEIKKDAQGNEYGMCTFTNGTTCDEWALFRNEGCKPFTPVTTTPAAAVGMANPASVNCGKVGATSVIMNNPDGSQYGVCKFSNGTVCEEWALYHGEGCKPNVAPTATPAK